MNANGKEGCKNWTCMKRIYPEREEYECLLGYPGNLQKLFAEGEYELIRISLDNCIDKTTRAVGNVLLNAIEENLGGETQVEPQS